MIPRRFKAKPAKPQSVPLSFPTDMRAKTEPSWFKGTSIGQVHLRYRAWQRQYAGFFSTNFNNN